MSQRRKPSYARLAALEAKRPKRPVGPELAEPMAEEEWLATFRQYAAAGLYDGEADFSEALRAYEAALEAAAIVTNPPFFPPADFQPNENDVERRERWRAGRHYREVNNTIVAVLDITERALKARMARDECGPLVQSGPMRR